VSRAAPVLEARDLAVAFRRIRPVDGISLTIAAGEAVGLVGESGCGKTTLAKAIALHLPLAAGSLRIGGRDVGGLRGSALRRVRRDVQLVFQDPQASLDPRQRVADALLEALDARASGRGGERAGRGSIAKLLAEVGLPDGCGAAYPHELSGGERQRVAIARALAVSPCLLVADEPTSALDVTVQARLLNLLDEARRRRGLGLLLISHDLHLVRHVCDRVAVMYLGRILESFPTRGAAPRHPYSLALAAATPALAKSLAGGAMNAPAGEVPSLRHPPSGCPWQPRCDRAEMACSQALPPLEAASPGHLVRCPPTLRKGRYVAG
jgi:oligopeptide/dipeptide ABC transporter ATP-binding protein